MKKEIREILIFIFFVCFLTGILPESLWADEIETRFQQANQLFQQEQYEEAIANYEAIIAQGYESGELYYNLGNAYFRLGDLGKSILNYERAKRLAPLDDDIRHNLEVANLVMKDKIEAPPRFFLVEIFDDLIEFFGLRMNLNAFTVLVLIVYCIFMMLIIMRILSNNPDFRSRVTYFLLPVFVLFIILIIFFQMQIYSNTHTNEAIVIAELVDVFGAPNENAKQLFSLHPGVKVKIQNQLSQDGVNWYEIQLIDGNTGWVNEAVLEKI